MQKCNINCSQFPHLVKNRQQIASVWIMNDRGEQRIISKMKGDAIRNLFRDESSASGNKIAVLFSTITRTCMHRSCNAHKHTRAPCNEDDEKRQGDSHFFPNDTEPLFNDRIIDLQHERLSINKKRCKLQ